MSRVLARSLVVTRQQGRGVAALLCSRLRTQAQGTPRRERRHTHGCVQAHRRISGGWWHVVSSSEDRVPGARPLLSAETVRDASTIGRPSDRGHSAAGFHGYPARLRILCVSWRIDELLRERSVPLREGALPHPPALSRMSSI
jgi:hypothetical protein